MPHLLRSGTGTFQRGQETLLRRGRWAQGLGAWMLEDPKLTIWQMSIKDEKGRFFGR